MVCSQDWLQVTTGNSHHSLLAKLSDFCTQILNIKYFHITNCYSTSRVPLHFGYKWNLFGKFQKRAQLLNLQQESGNIRSCACLVYRHWVIEVWWYNYGASTLQECLMSVIKGIVQSINFSPCSEMIKLNRLGVIYQELFQFRKPHSLQRERVWSHYNHQGVLCVIV